MNQKEEEEEEEEAFLNKFILKKDEPRPKWALQPDESGSLETALNSVPLFMSDAPTESDLTNNPTLQALQSLLFEDGTPEEIAANFREQGNEFFKQRRFEDARSFYTKGIETKDASKKTLSCLLANRAAVFIQLSKWTDALNDCKRAVKLDASNERAMLRGLKCAVKLKDRSFIAQVNLDAVLDKTLVEEARKILKPSINAADNDVHEYLETQFGLQYLEHCEDDILATLPSIDPNSLPGVRLINNQSVWPMIVFYPEHAQCDFIQEFNENDTFAHQLAQLFDTTPAWDDSLSYTLNNLCWYIVGQNGKLHQLDLTKRLSSIFPQVVKSYHRGILAVYSIPKDKSLLLSEFRRRFHSDD